MTDIDKSEIVKKLDFHRAYPWFPDSQPNTVHAFSLYTGVNLSKLTDIIVGAYLEGMRRLSPTAERIDGQQ